MAERIPGIINSPFSENGKLHPKSTLAKLLSDGGLGLDPEARKEEIVLIMEEQARQDFREGLLQRSCDPDDPFFAGSIESAAFWAGVGMRALDTHLTAPPRPGRPPLSAYRCLIATVAYLMELHENASPAGAYQRAAERLGPGIKPHHVKQAVSRIRRKPTPTVSPEDDAETRSLKEAYPRAQSILIGAVFEFLDCEHAQEKLRKH